VEGQAVKLSRQDFTIGAIDRMAVRRGIDRATVERLLHTRARLTERSARFLAGQWFNTEYHHGGIAFRRQEYLATRGIVS
jgi:hypothetical protein